MEVAFHQIDLNHHSIRQVNLSCSQLPPYFQTNHIRFEFDEVLPEPVVLDGFLFAFLHFAMRSAEPLRIRGPLSAKALRNARVLQEAWACWRPDTHTIIDISCEKIVDEVDLPSPKRLAAVALFSGGVDATFLALRQAHKPTPFFDIKDVLTVQGYDMPSWLDEAMKRLMDRTRPLLKSLGLRQRLIKTNLRDPDFKNEQPLQDWGETFGLLMSCALHQFEHEFGVGLIASSEPYSHMCDAWGSTPSTDYLLSGALMDIVHEGAGYSRTEKVALLDKHPLARAAVKFCWAGPDPATNCGECEKCVRTRLNFLAVGSHNPPCFESPFRTEMIESLKVNTVPQFTELLTIDLYARRRQIEGDWLDALRRRITELYPTWGVTRSP